MGSVFVFQEYFSEPSLRRSSCAALFLNRAPFFKQVKHSCALDALQSIHIVLGADIGPGAPEVEIGNAVLGKAEGVAAGDDWEEFLGILRDKFKGLFFVVVLHEAASHGLNVGDGLLLAALLLALFEVVAFDARLHLQVAREEAFAAGFVCDREHAAEPVEVLAGQRAHLLGEAVFPFKVTEVDAPVGVEAAASGGVRRWRRRP